MPQGEDPAIIGNLEIGGSFEGQVDQDANRLHSSRSNRRMGDGDVQWIDMEIVIGEQKYTIPIYPDSDPQALAHEFAAQHGLPMELVG